MGARQKEWARRARSRLMEELGEVCAECGEVACLTFDCIEPKGSRHHRLDTASRMCFYHAEHRRGNVQVLCLWCNSAKAGRRRRELVPGPF